MKRIHSSLFVSLALLLLTQACAEGEAPTTDDAGTVRIATFNIAMGLPEAGAMAAALESGQDPRLQALATVLQTIRPDVILLSEFDYDPAIDAANLLNANYLSVAAEGREAIRYPYHYQPPTNTGVDSGLDLDSNGETSEPADAWGYGEFPGQYGMLVLSRYPIDAEHIRTFQRLRWSQVPGALQPATEAGEPYYPEDIWSQLRLSSKNHADVPIKVHGHTVHLLASHPTPPVFDGPEDRNGARNHDELAFWARYLAKPDASWIIDNKGGSGGLQTGSTFVIAGDLNADPNDGDAHPDAIKQLLEHPAVEASCVPASDGGAQATEEQAGINLRHTGNPGQDTSDFNDETVGNYRLDYLLPSKGLTVTSCGVYWPVQADPHFQEATFSDHRLVWIDIQL
jgi:endonuclease/exonuclease/phosphatase family metal-dependent hydrolase